MLSRFIRDFKYSILSLTIGITLIILGVVREEYFIVLKKAVAICLQCIGIS